MAINAYYHVTPAGALAKDGSDWANAMGLGEFETSIEGGGAQAAQAGDVFFIMEGTYTFTSIIDFNAIDGTAVAPIALIGVKDTTTNEGANVAYSDWAILQADMPFFDCNTNYMRTGNWCIVRNISFEGESTQVLNIDAGALVENCKFNHDGAAPAAEFCIKTAFALYERIINCEFTSLNAGGIEATNSVRVAFCYFHDITDSTNGVGVLTESGSTVFAFNIFDDVYTAMLFTADSGQFVLNNTFYDGNIAVSATDDDGCCCINNIIEATASDGFKWTTQIDGNFFWKNHGDDVRCNDMWDLVDTTTIYQDYEVSTGDPKFGVAGADFSLDSDSPNIDNGMSIILGV